jgi:hypothetical protein
MMAYLEVDDDDALKLAKIIICSTRKKCNNDYF